MDDPDQMVVDHAMGKLIEYGDGIIPNLENLEDDCLIHPIQLENIAIVLDALRFHRIRNDLTDWLNSDDKCLMKAVYIICSYQYPELNIDAFTSKFQELKHFCWMEINSRQTSFEKVDALNKVFFDTFDFVKVNELPHSPFELFVNSVMESKEGTDLSLGLIYSIVAQSLDIPIYGVTTMNNRAPFILAYMDKDNLLPILDWGIDNNGVLFYISVGNKGLVIDPKQMKEAYLSEGLPQNRAQFEPSPNSVIIKKYLKDIKRSYENKVQFRYKLKDIDELLELF
ncbi:transglutaminase family protein [Brumimicrobium mesophilum]|uniref:transglutaminase family protein n=1 Tax=Brumimicrobium mesophilum TaxID=392717 RepID=UPI00131CFA44|nr:transglutaminase family protein [Brumimicrobium mesophilum]